MITAGAQPVGRGGRYSQNTFFSPLIVFLAKFYGCLSNFMNNAYNYVLELN